MALISKETGIPSATVFDHLKKLIGEKITSFFTIEVDHEKIGLGTMAFILIKYTPLQHVKQTEVAKNIAKIKGIKAVYIISGEWDILAKAHLHLL